MAKKKVLAIWFCCNIILTLYIVMRNRNLRGKLEEEERIASEQTEQFQRRYFEREIDQDQDWHASPNEFDKFQENIVAAEAKAVDKEPIVPKTFRKPVWKKPNLRYRNKNVSPNIKRDFPKLDNVLINWLGKNFLSYESTLYKDIYEVADEKNRFFLIYVDYSGADMAHNMQLINFDKFKNNNYLFVTADTSTMKDLSSRGVECHLFTQFDGNFGKMKLILLALLYGFNPIICDPNLIFMQDPMYHLNYENYDIALLQDTSSNTYSDAFGIIYATESSIDLLKQANKKFALSELYIVDIFNNINFQSKVKITKLDTKKFQSGILYYLEGKHEFVDEETTCYECVVIHNSGIQTKAAKIYRLKEGHQWEAEDMDYFINPEYKYITYENYYTGGDVAHHEHKALRAAFAIAAILDRILILPTMNCGDYKCNILHRYKIEAMELFLKGKYREHVFPKHYLVPPSIRHGQSPKIQILPLGDTPVYGKDIQTFFSKALVLGHVEATEIRRWIQGHWNHFAVLQFQSLNFEVRGVDSSFMKKIHKGLCESDYTQSAECLTF